MNQTNFDSINKMAEELENHFWQRVEFESNGASLNTIDGLRTALIMLVSDICADKALRGYSIDWKQWEAHKNETK